jgi:hypothetical protein
MMHARIRTPPTQGGVVSFFKRPLLVGALIAMAKMDYLQEYPHIHFSKANRNYNLNAQQHFTPAA